MVKSLFILLTFELLLSALTINETTLSPKVITYIASPDETLHITAKRCQGLTKQHGHYKLKAEERTLQCDNRTVKIILKEANIHKGKIDHYKIGRYPKPMRGLKSYTSPQHFLKVSSNKEQIKLSEHFEASRFLCKQASRYPKYLIVQTSLINLLELMIKEAAIHGVIIKNFVIMSGYRTPSYNSAIGSSKYSRHMYGDASDIYVDDDHDGFMDDLNGDGKTTDADTRWLASLANDVQRKYDIKGGVGIYKRTSHHPRFVHVDTRGYYARWGH